MDLRTIQHEWWANKKTFVHPTWLVAVGCVPRTFPKSYQSAKVSEGCRSGEGCVPRTFPKSYQDAKVSEGCRSGEWCVGRTLPTQATLATWQTKGRLPTLHGYPVFKTAKPSVPLAEAISTTRQTVLIPRLVENKLPLLLCSNL